MTSTLSGPLASSGRAPMTLDDGLDDESPAGGEGNRSGDGPGGGGSGGRGGGGGGDGDGAEGADWGSGAGGSARRRGRAPLIGAAVAGCVVALLIAVLATSKSTSQSPLQATSPLQGKQAPEIAGPLLDGGTGRLSSDRGKWVVLNFFASWCVPCQQEQGDLVRFADAHADRGDAVIFAVRFDDPDVGPIRDLMAKSGGHWPIVDNANAKIDYGVTGPPESFLIDPGGIVRAHVIGKVTAGFLEQLVAEAQGSATTPGQTATVPAGSRATAPSGPPATSSDPSPVTSSGPSPATPSDTSPAAPSAGTPAASSAASPGGSQ